MGEKGGADADLAHSAAHDDGIAQNYLDAALVCLAETGLRGFSLRSVAQRAGGSLGSLSYRFGGRQKLIEAIIERETATQQMLAAEWQHRLQGLNLVDPAVLAQVIAAYIDELAQQRRDASLALCECVIGASVTPGEFPGLALLLQQPVTFWQDQLTAAGHACPMLLGRAIAGYIADELPFTIACGGEGAYRLLRSATIQRLAEQLGAPGAGIAQHFDRLVEACGKAEIEGKLSIDLPAGSRKAELAGHITALMADQGLAAVTHRAVALRAEVPNSTIAHHFRSQQDLLYAGVAGLAVLLRGELRGQSGPNPDHRHGLAIIRASHAAALAAARDPAFIPFALDMRRQRAVNVRQDMGHTLGLDPLSDGAGIQAATMVRIGCGLMTLTSDGQTRHDEIGLPELGALSRGA